MNTEYFIANRLVSDKNNKNSIAAPITKIAIIAVAIGIIMMLVSISTGVGLQIKIRQKISAFNGHISISSFNNNQSEVSTEPINNNDSYLKKLKQNPDIKNIQGVIKKGGMIRTPTAFEGILFKGVGSDFYFDDFKEFLVQGKLPNFKSELNNEILISKYLCDRLDLKLNQEFNTFFMKEGENKMPKSRRFKIVGIYNSGFQEFDQTIIIGDIRHTQKMNHWLPNQVGSLEINIKNFSEISEISNQIYKEIPSTLNAKSITEKYYNIFEWLKLFDFNILVVIIIMILVSSINIIVALLVLILERTQMIGILKSMGADNWFIRKIFLYNSMYLVFKGMFWGNLIALLFLFIQKYFQVLRFPNPEQYYCTFIPVDINLFFIFVINLLIFIVIMLFLIIPSAIISKISPSKSIRFS